MARNSFDALLAQPRLGRGAAAMLRRYVERLDKGATLTMNCERAALDAVDPWLALRRTVGPWGTTRRTDGCPAWMARHLIDARELVVWLECGR